MEADEHNSDPPRVTTVNGLQTEPVSNGVHPLVIPVTISNTNHSNIRQDDVTTAGSPSILPVNVSATSTNILWDQQGERGREPPINKLQRTIQAVRKRVRVQRLINEWRDPNVPGEILCETCHSLRITTGDFIVDRPSRDRPRSEYLLGQLREIFDKVEQCRLCRLIICAFTDQLHPQHPQDVQQSLDPEILSRDIECRISWEIDGTQINADQYGELVEEPKTRRLRLAWSDPAFKDAYIILAYTNTALGPVRPFLGRLQTSLDEPIAKQLKDWYNICCDTHGRCRKLMEHRDYDTEFEALRSEPYFGVIDLAHMKVAPLPKGEKYAALSYVWGDKKLRADKFKLTLEHIDNVCTRDGLKKVFDQLPITIQDAFRVARALEIRYLWVDALCIVQDDLDFWQLNASKMHLIYGHADVTICAADGKGANAGTVAFYSKPSKNAWHFRQHVEYVREGLNLMVWNPLETYLERATWSERGWTFQEYQLSQRLIVFVEGRMYFQCPSTTLSLDKYMEDTSPSKPQSALDAYRSSVMEYTPRHLTNSEDIVVAFSGVGTRLCRDLGGTQVFCMPNSHFDWALLWQPASAPKRREPFNGIPFPSWSWCGWESAQVGYPASFTAGCELNIHEWLRDHTWISWYIRDWHGNLNLVWDPLIFPAAKDDEENACGYRHRAPQELMIGQGIVSASQQHDIYGRKLPDRLKLQNRHEFDKKMPKWPYNVKTNQLGSVSNSPHQRFLQFFTWSAHFSVKREHQTQSPGEPPDDPGNGLARFRIFDGNGDFAGTIVLPEDFVKKRGPRHEFIALSEARPFSQQEGNIWDHWTTSKKEGTEWYLHHAMLLEYEDPQKRLVAQRVGVGKMYKKAFEHPVSDPEDRATSGKKQWKEIILG